MTISDRFRRGASIIKSHYRKNHVWIIDELKLGYISIPKVASSSIRVLMTAQQRIHLGEDEGGERSKTLKDSARFSLSHKKIIELKEEYHLFSFVRNPLTRLYSCYRDKVVNAAQRHDRCTLSPYRIHFGMSFDEFVCRVVEIPDKSADQHFRSLSSFLLHKDRLLVDYVGRFEQLTSDWVAIESQFGISLPNNSGRISGAPVDLSNLPISKEAIKLVMKRYAQDLDAFDYRKDLEDLLG